MRAKNGLSGRKL